MKRWLITAALAGAALVAATTASAQQAAEPDVEPRLSGSVLGGLTLPLGEARDAMGTGWNAGVAGSVRVAPGLALRADYLYSRFAAATRQWDVTLGPWLPAFQEVTVNAKSQMHALSLDLSWSHPLSRGRRVYLMAGPTLFRRRVQIRGDGPQGDTSACEPLWLQCQEQPLAFDRATGIKKSDDLGFNVGAGVTLPIGLSAALTVEARYFQVRGPAFRGPEGGSVRASARFVPLSVGLAF